MYKHIVNILVVSTYLQELFDHEDGSSRHEFCDLVVSLLYQCIQCGGVVIIERQEPIDQSVQ